MTTFYLHEAKELHLAPRDKKVNKTTTKLQSREDK